MSEMVHCDLCGKVYSSKHLSSHKRLAHSKAVALQSTAAVSEAEAMRMILALFDGLSEENRKQVTERLSERGSVTTD